MKKWVRVRTKNGTADPLRRSMLTDEWAVVRLGSLTPTETIFPNRRCIEINTVDAVQNSRSKIRMKEKFEEYDVPQATWSTFDREFSIDDIEYPIVVKRVFGFQGRGMQLINNRDEFRSWMDDHRRTIHEGEWFFEKFYNYSREYRLHVARGQGVIMSWRKLRTREATERWFFNNSNSNWVGPGHELFDKPKSWKKMEKAAIAALEATGLDIGAVDIRVQSARKKDPKFIVCEINSAPALGEMGIEEYKKAIVKLIDTKKHERDNM